MTERITAADGEAARERLTVLCLDYEMAREDERTFQSIQAVLVGVAVALTATLSAVLTRSGVLLDEAAAPGEGSLTYVPEPLLVVTPLVPYALIAFAVLLGAVSTIRSYYLRALEADLQDYAGPNLKALPFPPGGYAELISELVSVRRGIRWYPYLVLFILVAALMIFGGFVAYVYSGLDTTVARLAMIALYLPASIFVLVQAGQATIGGRGLFADVGRSYLARRAAGRPWTIPGVEPAKEDSPAGEGERAISWYLVLPRPDEVPKALFLLLVYLVAAYALGSFSGDSLLRAFVVWIAFEYLLYEARYQWNDIRGLHEVYSHRERALRRRLPLGDDPPASTVRNVRLSVGIILARFALAVVLALAAGHDTLAPVLVLTAAVVATAVPYEWLRSRAVDAGASPRGRRLIRGIWVFVGSGYVVRGLTGLWLAGFALDSAEMALGAGAFGAYGVMFVTLTWALDSLAQGRRLADGTVVPGDSGRRKPHADALLPYMDVPPPAGEDELARVKGLLPRGRYLAPWNVALFAAAALGGALGVAIVHPGDLNGWIAAGAAVGLGGSLLLAYVGHRGRIAVFVAVALALTIAGAQVDIEDSFLAASPWLFFAGLYIVLRNSSSHSLKHWFGDLRTPVKRILSDLVVVVVGRKTLAALPGLRGWLGDERH